MNVCLAPNEFFKAPSIYSLMSSGFSMYLTHAITSGQNHPIFIRGSQLFKSLKAALNLQITHFVSHSVIKIIK